MDIRTPTMLGVEQTPAPSPPLTVEVKQSPSVSTAVRTGVVAGISLSPVAVGPVLGYIFSVINAIWPAIPPPTEVQTLNMAIVIMAVAAGIVSWRVRGSTFIDSGE
jgi:hypothetical protein